MEETYEDIVRKWYGELRGKFTGLLMDKYRGTNMRLADVENIYQDIFIAIGDNLREGRIQENSQWRSYIMTVGLNMASKLYKSTISQTDSYDETDATDPAKLSAKAQRLSDIIKALPSKNDELYTEPEAQALLGEELTHTPEPCASIIRSTYINDMTDAEIAEEVPPYCNNGKSVEVNAKAIKARRWLCMRDLIYRVKLSLFNAGLINEKPEKFTRNKIDIGQFEDYLTADLTSVEQQNPRFLLDYRLFIMAVRGIVLETEQDNIEFGRAMKSLTREQLMRIIGQPEKPARRLISRFKERLFWAASVAVIVVAGVFSIFSVHRSGMNRLDDAIVAYNYIPDDNRGWESLTGSDIPSLEMAYQSAPTDDVQAAEDAGMRLAMAYLKIHDRDAAKRVLTRLAERFADDEEFAAQCRRILDQLK